MFATATATASADDTNNNSSSSSSNLFDHLVLYRFHLNQDNENNIDNNNNENNENDNIDDELSYVWWPVLLFDSHNAALARYAQKPASDLLEHRRFCWNLLKELDEPAVPVLELLGFPQARWIHPSRQAVAAFHDAAAAAVAVAAATTATTTTTTTTTAAAAEPVVKRDILPLTVTAAKYLRQQDAKQHAAAFEQAMQEVSKILSGSPPQKKTTTAARASSTATATTSVTCMLRCDHEKQESLVEHHQQKDNTNHDTYGYHDDDDGDQVMQQSQQQQEQEDNNDDEVPAELEDDDAPAELEDPGILPSDSWEAVWNKLQWIGWVQYHDPVSRQDLYSMPPAFDHYYDQTSYTLGQLQQFCQATYHWQPPLPQRRHVHDGRSVVSTSNTTLTTVESTLTPNRPTHPQDPGAPLLSSSSSDGSSVVSNPYEWKYLWGQRLQKEEGWECVRSWDPLDDWYYCKRGVSKSNGVLGQNFFKNQTDVIRYVQAQDGYQLSEPEDDPSPTGPRRKRGRSVVRRLSLDSVATHTNKKKKRSQQQQERTERSKSTTRKQPQEQREISLSSSSSSTRKRSNSKTTVRRSNPNSAAKTSSQRAVVTDQKKKKQKSKKTFIKKQDWWKSEPIPTAPNVQPILEKLGVQCNENGTYILPFQDLQFDSSRGLGILFLQAGVPNLSKLTKTETARLTRWARFVNVPAAAATPDILKRLKLPVNATQLYNMLRILGFEIALEYIYLPNSPADRKLNVHYFLRSDWNTKFRKFLQTSWCLESPPADKEQNQQEDRYNNGWTAEQQEVALTLRLWGALYDDDDDMLLVSLKELPKPNRRGGGGVDLSKLQHLPEPLPVTLDFLENQDKDDKNKSQGSAIQAMKVASANDKALSLVTPMLLRKPKKDRPPLQKDDVPNFSDVWPILYKMGWRQTSSGHYQHHSFPNRSFVSTVDVRRFVATTAIPDIERGAFSDEEKRALNRWAMTVNLDDQCFGFEGLSDAKKLKANQVLKILYALGFSSANEKLYLIHADRYRETRRPFTLESLLLFILTHDNWSGDPERKFRPQDYDSKITRLEMMQLMRFALEMVKPSLPTFRTPEKPKSKRRRRILSHFEPQRTLNEERANSKNEVSTASEMESGKDEAPQTQDQTELVAGDTDNDKKKGSAETHPPSEHREEEEIDSTVQKEIESKKVDSEDPMESVHEETEQSNAADNDKDMAHSLESSDTTNVQDNFSQPHDSTDNRKDEIADLSEQNEDKSSGCTECLGRLLSGEDDMEMALDLLQHEGNGGHRERDCQKVDEETDAVEAGEHQFDTVEHALHPLLTQAEETLGACSRDEEDSVYFSAPQEDTDTTKDSCQKPYTDETFEPLNDLVKETYQMINDMTGSQTDFLTQDP